MGFTAAQRMETLLAETEDVAREDQIIIQDGVRTAQMAAAIEDPARLKETAIMPRDAVTLTEAENIVRDKEKGFLNKPITNSLQELREKAEKHIPELDTWAKNLAAGIKEKYGIELDILWRRTDKDNPLPIKTVKSIQDKLDSGEKIINVLDVMGITIVAKNLQEMVKVAEELNGRDDVVRIKDRYKELEDTGYRDILANIELSDGMIAEVQVNVEQMLAAKKTGHKLFAIPRSFPEAIKENLITEEQADNDFIILQRISKELYDAAYQAVLEESQFNASSRDTVLPSKSKRENRDLSRDLSSFTLNKFKELGLDANSSLLNTSPSLSKNFKSESSNDGTSAAGAGDVTLSTGAAEAETSKSSLTMIVPSANSIANKKDSVNSNSQNIAEKNSEENEKRIAKAKAKWEAAERVRGAEDQITLQTGEEITGRYELGEAGITTPSHDPDANFNQSEGFPVNENGTSMNVGRDYNKGFAMDAALRLADGFDQRGTGIIVDSNGVTSSGNNRDISRRIAAKDGTDGKYVSYLKSRPERWGFTKEDIAKFKHPTVYFVVNAPSVYTPLYFDQFNRSGKKSVSPIETAIKMSHLVKPDMVREFSEALGNYDSISELYEDTQAAMEIFKSLMKRGIVTQNSYPEYVESMSVKGKQIERVTSGGKDFLESVMLGAVLDEDSIRSLAAVPEVRKRVVKGLAALVDNAALGEYSVIAEINRAIAVAAEVQTNKKKYKSIADYAGQTEMELGQHISTDIEVELAARLLEKTEYAFADMMGGLNAILREEARGQSDMFGGTDKDSILRRYLGVKAKADKIREANNKIIEDENAAGLEKVQAAMENAGLAKAEADGTMFQIYGDSDISIKNAPLDNSRALALFQLDEIYEQYHNEDGTAKEGWLKAPNGKPTNLTERQWLTARTENFKKWFGDWERAARIAAIEGIQAKSYALNDAIEKKAAKKIFTGFAPVGKSFVTDFFESKDERKKPRNVRKEANNVRNVALNVSFTGKRVGGLRGFFNNKTTNIISDIREIFENSQYAYSSNHIITEPRKDGSVHKDHSNIEAYHHFVNKVAVDGQTYYVRFTAHEERKSIGKLHSAHISEIEIINEKSRESSRSLLGKHQGGTATPAYDKSLAEFFNSVKPDSISRIVDENGEPLPVYHGTDKRFEIFDISKARQNADIPAFFFTNDYTEAQEYGDANSYFLNIRNPKYDKPVVNMQGSAVREELVKQGFDGAITDEGGIVEYAAFEPNQIKSATDNAGTFDPKNNSILFQLDDELVEDAAQYGRWQDFRDAYQEKSTLFQAAYHGSPHRFERFDSSHIGTGWGAQVYGRGHYFASKKAVAEWYRKKTAGYFDGFCYVDGEQKYAGYPGEDLYEMYQKAAGGKLDGYIRSWEKKLEGAKKKGWGYEYEASHAKEILEEANGLKGKKVEFVEGQLYKADIPGDEELLDWNEKLLESPSYDDSWPYKLEEVREKGKAAGLYLDGINLRLTGEEIYASIRQNFIEEKGLGKDEAEEQASILLNSAGFKGIRYFDDSSHPAAGGGTHNYVIFDDNDINITRTYFQLDEGDNAWYRSLWNDAQKIHNDTLFQEDEEKTSRAGELDKRFYKEADKKYLTEALKELYRVHNDESLEPSKEDGDSAREEFGRIKRLKKRIDTELPNAGSVIGMAAQVRSGRELSSTQYDRLKGFIRKNMRDYRAVLADIMGQEEYLEDLAETKDGEPAGRLANPRPDKQDIKGRLKEIAKIIKEYDPALAKEIEDGTASYDDPRIAAFEAGVETEYNEGKAALESFEKETAEDYARLANDAQRRIVNIHEKMIKAREQLESTNEKLRRMMDEEGKAAEPYLKKQRLEQASYDQALKAYNDLINLYGMDAEVRETVARREAHASERVKQTGIRRRQRALKELKEIKQRLVKRVTRKVNFDNVAFKQAEMIKAIQRISEAFIFEGINKWIGPKGREILRGVWSQWSTDEEFREKLKDEVFKSSKRGDEIASRIENILDKDWKKISVNEKRTLHRLLPKTDLINDLKLKELARENRESIQLDINENFIDGKVQMIIGPELKSRLKETLGDELFNRILNKPLAEWSIAEAEELARIVDRLTVEGRQDRAAQKEARRVIEEEYRDKVLEALGKVKVNPDDTPEEQKKERERILKKFAGGKKNKLWNNFFDANLRRFTTALDGGRKGIFTNLLYWGENDAYNEEQRQIAARRIVIDKVLKDNNITLDELYKEVKIPGFEGMDLDLYEVTGGKVTVDDLLYIMRGYENEETRNALIYGNFSNAGERGRMERSLEFYESFANIGFGRMMAAISYAKEFFAKEENKKFMALYDAIGADYDRNGERLNKAVIEMFGRPMWRVDKYVPMNRREQTGAENENRVLEDLMGVSGAGMKWVNKGFTEKRQKISPGGQKPIELGLYKTWAKSVKSTEHLLAYGPMVQTLNAVFKGFHAGEVRQDLKKRWGQAADDRIADTIAEFANPEPYRQRSSVDNLVRSLRGKTATAYLAWKTSGIMKQLMTSPWPYLQEIPPHEYIAACLEVAAGAGKVNEFIREKSIYMKNRDFDPMVKLIREARENNDNAVLSKIDKFNSVGMKGLEWVDWICVAPGWLAVYKKELVNVAKEQQAKYEELLQKYRGSEYSDVLPTEESRANRALAETMNEEQQDYEAVARADDAVRRMQPSSRSTDIAPLFKGKNEAWSAILQFQMSLNVIWQNIRYDLPLAVKEKQIGTVVGMVTGYMMAGICLGMLSEIGNDDDDEEGKKARRILFYSFTQFTDAVPVIGGDIVTGTLEKFITGKKSYSGQQNIFPAVKKAFGGMENIAGAIWADDPDKRRECYERAVKGMAEGAGIWFGLPVSGIKEAGALTGIGDGDGEADLYWQALLGQRKK